jgi:DNA-binding MarR family transcriptional regulator
MLALCERSPRTLKDISDSLLHDPATLSPLLKRLEEAQLITRERVPGNERALAITLTDKGAALRAQATAVPGEIRNRLHLSREEVAELHQAMTGLIAATQRTADEPRKMEAT